MFKNSKPNIITSCIEHPAILECLKYFLNNNVITLTILPVNSEGVVNIEYLESLIKEETILVTIMHSNNEVGSIQPIKDISDICSNYKNLNFHVDAAQSIGKVNVDLN